MPLRIWIYRFVVSSIVIASVCRPDATLATVDYTQRFGILNASGSPMAGEAQSTVVAPGKSKYCPGGRILYSLDWNRVPGFDGSNGSSVKLTDTDLVRYADLDAPRNASSTRRSFFTLPSASRLQYQSYSGNDHDLITVANGDVLYVFALGYRAPDSRYSWFDFTYRNAFGPGARTAIAIFKSTDCGGHFSFTRVFEPTDVVAKTDFPVGECQNPQVDGHPVADWKSNYDTYAAPTAAPSPREPYYFDMGGTDGQEVVADYWSRRIYLAYQCVGNIVTAPPPGSTKIDLSDTPVDHTVVEYSDDEGTTWQPYLWLPNRYWRLNLVPSLARKMDGGNVAFSTQTSLLISGDPYTGAPAKIPPPPHSIDLTQGQSGTPNENITTAAVYNRLQPALNSGCTVAKCGMYANVYANSVIAGAGNGYVMAVPWDVPAPPLKAAHGYRVFYYSLRDGSLTEERAIVPTNCCTSALGFIMNLVAVQVGDSALLYWADIDAISHRGHVRARFVQEKNQWIPDFDIMAPTANVWDTHPSFFYGDYHTAGGYELPATSRGVRPYVAFPMWIEPNGVYFSRVEIDVPSGPLAKTQQDIVRTVKPKTGWPRSSLFFDRLRG
ncbi:MAG: hypothetical protein IAI49_07445 [Candidatus Eremiobacteraeota bacterium]|nr:hypothetical protein [Candidatus Eremiobacteraeota bacterium]